MANIHNIGSIRPYFIFITGASGAGKTTILNALEQELPLSLVSVNYFDSIGVPPLEEMVRIHGSGEKWQEASTHLWIDKLTKIKDKKLIFLEGQFNPRFAISYLKKLGIENYLIFCLHADRHVRERRLIEIRKQPELANDEMENWSNVLKELTLDIGGIVIESSGVDAKATARKIVGILEDKLLLDPTLHP